MSSVHSSIHPLLKFQMSAVTYSTSNMVNSQWPPQDNITPKWAVKPKLANKSLGVFHLVMERSTLKGCFWKHTLLESALNTSLYLLIFI